MRNALIIDQTRIRGSTGNDQLRANFLCGLLELIIIDLLGLRIDTVKIVMIDLAYLVCGGTVGQVSTLVKTHRKDLIARLQNGSKYRVVCCGT